MTTQKERKLVSTKGERHMKNHKKHRILVKTGTKNLKMKEEKEEMELKCGEKEHKFPIIICCSDEKKLRIKLKISRYVTIT